MVLFDNLYVELFAQKSGSLLHELYEEVYPDREVRRAEYGNLFRAFVYVRKLFGGVSRRRDYGGHTVLYAVFHFAFEAGGEEKSITTSTFSSTSAKVL